MRRLRKFLIGVIALVVSAVSVMGGGMLGGEVYAKNVMWKCKNSAGVEVYCTQDGSGNTIYAPEGFTPKDLPEDLGANDIPKYWQAWEKEKETGDSSDKDKIMDDWQVSEESKTANEVNGDGSATEQMMDTCSGAGGAKSLGWIVCPIMSFFGSAADGVYNKLLEPLLEVDPALFTGGSGDTSTNVTREQGWGTFRDIGNGVVIVMLLVVIFSQLTGVGIDNYGIKKVLPKIVVAAILMNLSYWICVAFVDVSNILGRGLKDMFNFLADGNNLVLDTSDMENGGTANLTAAGNTFVSAAVLSAMVGGAGIMIWSNPALVLTLLIAAIGIVVAVFFLFILFAVREAAILVLVVVSPVAIALYMLPNTKSVFDKWLKLFEGMLLVYPVSGLLIGAGNFVSRLLLSGGMSSSGFFATFTSMIVGIVPVFFIPSMLKGSFNAMGRIGAKISGVGNQVGARLQRGVQRSPGFRGAMARADETYMRRMAGIGDDGNARDLGRFRRAIRGGTRNIQDSQSRYKHFVAMTGNKNWDPSDATQFNDELEAVRNQVAYKNFSDHFSNMNSQELKDLASGDARQWGEADEMRMNALLSVMQAKGGMTTDIYNLLEHNASVGAMTSVTDMLAGSKDKVLKAYGKKANGASFSEFMSGTGEYSMEGYIKSKGADFIDGLDDDALTLINDKNNGAMSTDLLVQAASQIRDSKTLGVVNQMLAARSDLGGKISGEQLANMDNSTIQAMTGAGAASAISASAALKNATIAAMSDPHLASRISDEKLGVIKGSMSASDLAAFNNQISRLRSPNTPPAPDGYRQTDSGSGIVIPNR